MSQADGIAVEDMLWLKGFWDLYFRFNDSVAQIMAIGYGFSTTEEYFGLGGIDSDNGEPEVTGARLGEVRLIVGKGERGAK